MAEGIGTLKKKWWIAIIACLMSQHLYLATSLALPERPRVSSNSKQQSDSEIEVHHRAKRGLGGVFKFVLKNFWDDLVCLGLNLATTFNCGSLTPGTCDRLNKLDDLRDAIQVKINQTLDQQIAWSIMNSTNDKAITSLYMIGKELEIIASSNIRMMEILRALDAVEENSTAYIRDDSDNVSEQKIRFRVDLEKFLNGVKATLDSSKEDISIFRKKDFAMLALSTAIPILVMHTGLITTSARTAFLSSKQDYQVVEFIGKKGSYQLAYNSKGKMFIVQENPKKLGKLKVFTKLDGEGKVGKFWRFMMPAGQKEATNAFLASVDYKRAQKVANLQKLEPDYLKKLHKSGHLPAFLRSTDGLTPEKFDEFVNRAKTKDPKLMFSGDNVDTSLPKWMRNTLSLFDPNDVASMKAYNKLKGINPDLMLELQKKGKLGSFISQSKGLSDADFDDYVKKVKAASLQADGLKNFDFDSPAKKVKWYSWENMKSGWDTFSNKKLFSFRGRKVKVSSVLNMGNLGSALNVGLCLYMSISSTLSVNEKIDGIETKLNDADKAVDLKLAQVQNMTADEVKFFGLIKNNFYGIVSMFDMSEDSTSVAADPNCKDSLCIFLREAATLNPIKKYIATWPNASITTTTILEAEYSFLGNLTASKNVMVQLYRQSEMVAQIMTWVDSELSIAIMMKNADTLSRAFDNKYDLLVLIAKAFPDRDEYTSYPLKCIRTGSIANDTTLNAWMTSNQVKSLDPKVSNYIENGVDFDSSVDRIVKKINEKIAKGDFPANGCGGGNCARKDVLTEIANTVLPNAASYDGVQLQPYRQKTIVCPSTTG